MVRESANASNVETLTAPESSTTPTAGSSPPAFANGTIISEKYQVEEKIAEGGIGVVVVARHLVLHQRVAIKYLKQQALSNPTIVERFLKEARLAAQLKSEHVVRVYDVGTLPNGGPYMVMEYLIGEDLGRTVQNGPLPLSLAVDYTLQACDALAEAHALRIVHRDIKPENLFIAQRSSNSSILKIIDFGISKVRPKRGDSGYWGTETAAGERFGTPLYMSPEQLRSSSRVDARTDIWSLGVVMHELLTGALPFRGEDLPQVCTSVLTEPPILLTERCPGAPPELEAVLLKCLEKDPDKRFPNVAELARALAPFGPPGATERAERIVEVTRLAGESFSPRSAVTGTVAPASVAQQASRPLATTHSRAMTTVITRGSKNARRWAAFVVIAGIAGAASLMALGVGRSRAVHTSSPAGPTPAAAAPPPGDRLLVEAPAATQTTHASEPIRSGAEPVAPHAKAGATPRPPRVPAVAPMPSPIQSPPSNTRRAQFGERE
jgi:serine/threonine-protein kinase